MLCFSWNSLFACAIFSSTIAIVQDIGSTVWQESLVGVKFDEFTRFEHLAKTSLANEWISQKLIIVSRNLYGFSLANCL